MVKNVIIGVLVFIVACLGGGFIAYTNMMNTKETTKVEDSNTNNIEKPSEDKSKKDTNKKDTSKNISAEQRKKMIADITNGMTIKNDDMTNTVDYSYGVPEITNKIYFGAEVVKDKNDNQARLYPVAIYRGDDWIFFDAFLFKIDNERVTIRINKFKKTDDVITGAGVIEIYNMQADGEMETALRKIASAKNVRMRFVGQYTAERDMTQKEITQISNIVKLYDLLKKE